MLPPPYKASFKGVIFLVTLFLSPTFAETSLKIDSIQQQTYCDITSSQSLTNCYFYDPNNPDNAEAQAIEAGRLGKGVTWSGNTSIEFTTDSDVTMPKYNLEVQAPTITFKSSEEEVTIPTNTDQNYNKTPLTIGFGIDVDDIKQNAHFVGDLTVENMILIKNSSLNQGADIEGNLTLKKSWLGVQVDGDAISVSGKTTLQDSLHIIAFDRSFEMQTDSIKTNTDYHVLHSDGGIDQGSATITSGLITLMPISNIINLGMAEFNSAKYFDTIPNIADNDIYLRVEASETLKNGSLLDFANDVASFANERLEAKLTEADSNTYVQNEVINTLGCGSWDNCKTVLRDNSTQTREQVSELFTSSNAGIIESFVGSSSISAMSVVNGVATGSVIGFKNEVENNAAYKNIGNNQNQAISLNNKTAVATRVAKYSNPYSKPEYAFSKAIKELSGERLADSSDSVISGYVSKYLNRYSQNNNVWANLLGGYNNIGDGDGYIGGISAGYDGKIGDSSLLGGYLTYSYGGYSTNFLETTTNNLTLGLYQRSNIGKHEIDAMINYTMGFVDETTVFAEMFSSINKANYLSHNLSANVDYGYVFGDESIANGVFIKPLVGLNFYYNHIPSYKQSGTAAQEFNKQDSFSMSASIGLEVRKYFDDISFIYFKPSFEQFVVVSGNDLRARFADSQRYYTIKGDNRLRNYVQVLLGGEIGVNDSISITLSAGLNQAIIGFKDASSKNINETYLSANAGFKYKF